MQHEPIQGNEQFEQSLQTMKQHAKDKTNKWVVITPPASTPGQASFCFIASAFEQRKQISGHRSKIKTRAKQPLRTGAHLGFVTLRES